jgi:predicted GNAT family acetyltransferase
MDIVNNEVERRFETTIDDHTAELTYRRHGDRLVLVHTEVPDELEGMGVGGALVTAGVDFAAQHGLTVVPMCPFARGWLERHPDVAQRVTIQPAN